VPSLSRLDGGESGTPSSRRANAILPVRLPLARRLKKNTLKRTAPRYGSTSRRRWCRQPRPPLPFCSRSMDITERVRFETALRASEQRWRAMFEISPVGITTLDFERRRYVTANESFQRMTGYTEAELRNLTTLELTHEDDRAAMQERIDSGVSGFCNGSVTAARTARSYGPTSLRLSFPRRTVRPPSVVQSSSTSAIANGRRRLCSKPRPRACGSAFLFEIHDEDGDL
jgi:PAS domain S-box-containing protein